jgi:hypothetical protein
MPLASKTRIPVTGGPLPSAARVVVLIAEANRRRPREAATLHLGTGGGEGPDHHVSRRRHKRFASHATAPANAPNQITVTPAMNAR